MEASGITMPEDNEASVKARRISHIMRQVRKRATVSSANTSGKPGSAGAEHQLSAFDQGSDFA